MNIASVTEKVRARIHAVITEMVSEITQEVTKEVVSQLAGAPSIAPVKRAARAATAKRTPRAEPAETKAPAARKPRAAKPAKAAATTGAPQAQRYGLDPSQVLVKLAFYGEAGVKAETIRKEFFPGFPTAVFGRALKKLIGGKLAKVTGERRAATYFITAKGLKAAGAVAMDETAAPAAEPSAETFEATSDAPQEAGDEDLSKLLNGASDEPVSTRLLQDNTAEDAAS